MIAVATGALARATDPDTSHEAAAIVARNLTRRQQDVLRVMRQHTAISDVALVAMYDLAAAAGRVSQQSQSGIRTRRCELVRRGLVRDSGKRVRLGSGRGAIAWEVVR